MARHSGAQAPADQALTDQVRAWLRDYDQLTANHLKTDLDRMDLAMLRAFNENNRKEYVRLLTAARTLLGEAVR